MRLLSLVLASLYLVAFFSSNGFAMEKARRDYGRDDYEMRQIVAIFPDITFTPCTVANDQSFQTCVKDKLFLGYLGWSFWAAFRDRDVDELLSSRPNLAALKHFNVAKEGAISTVRPLPWPLTSDKELEEFLQWFPRFAAMRSCLLYGCGTNVEFGTRTHMQAVDFWEKSLLFIWCVKRQKTHLPPSGLSEPVGVSRIYRLAQAGKLGQCPATNFPKGLVEVIARIQPNPGSF